MMKETLGNIKSLIVAIIAFVGGAIWCFQTNWNIEPLILLVGASFEIIIFIIIKLLSLNDSQHKGIPSGQKTQQIVNNGNIKKQLNINENNGNIQM